MSAAVPVVVPKKKVKPKKPRIVFESPFTKRLASAMNANVEARLREQVLAAFEPFERRPGVKARAKQPATAADDDKAASAPAWSDLTRSVALGVNAVSRALEQNLAVGVVVCGCHAKQGRPQMLVAHLFAAAAARSVPTVELQSLDGAELAQSIRMRTLGAFAILRDAPVASFVALGEAVVRYAPRATSLPWVAVYLTEIERESVSAFSKAEPAPPRQSSDAADATQPPPPPPPPPRNKRSLLEPSQARRVRSRPSRTAQ